MSDAARIGIISDTHGLLRPAALDALAGSDHIVHGGDIGNPGILDALARIAPVTAVRGNNDRGAWAQALPETAIVEVAGVRLFVIHDLASLDAEPAALGVHAVVSGHSHKPRTEWRGGVLYLNPGSAGPRRFTLPIALARLHVASGVLRAELVELDG